MNSTPFDVSVDYERPIYDPLIAPDEENYFPADRLTLLFVLVKQGYSDIERLCSVASQIDDFQTKRLLAKYALIEWFSLDCHLRKLFNLILKDAAEFPLVGEQFGEVRDHRRAYVRATKRIHDQFRDVRDKVAAHRDEKIGLVEVARYWDAFDWGVISEACSPVVEAFELLKSLNIYRWTLRRLDEKGNEVIGLVLPAVPLLSLDVGSGKGDDFDDE